jgi:hypothetical protein
MSPIKIKFVIDSSFDPSIDFQTLLKGYEWKAFDVNSHYNYSGRYYLDLSYSRLSGANHMSLVDFLTSIAHVGQPNGYSLNETATYLYSEENALIEDTGVAFNASDTVEWIANNLWDQTLNQYTLFLLNLTEFDITYGVEHWYSVQCDNLDTNATILQENSNAGIISAEYGKQVSAWGGLKDYPIHFIDFSARNWWGDYIKELGYAPSAYRHLQKILQDFSNPINVLDSEFRYWLESWIDDFILGLFIEPLAEWDPEGEYFKIADSISLPIIICNNLTMNHNMNNLSWIVHKDLIENELENSFTWIDFDINITWLNLSDHIEMNQEIIKYLNYTSSNGKRELDIRNLDLNQYLRTSFVPEYVNISTSKLVLPTVSLLLDDVISAGISASWAQICLFDYSYLYLENGSLNRGLSNQILQLIGHSLGLTSPYNWGSLIDPTPEWGFCSDFSASLMGIYPNWNEFSIYDINTLGHATSDYYLVQAEILAEQLLKEMGMETTTTFDETLEILYESQRAQENWKYPLAIYQAKEAITKFRSLENQKSNNGSLNTRVFFGFFLLILILVSLGIVLKIQSTNNN